MARIGGLTNISVSRGFLLVRLTACVEPLWCGRAEADSRLHLAVIVFENGKSGFNGEHSCMDGTPTSRLNDWLLRSLDAGKVPLGDSARSLSALPSVTPLTFNLPPQVQSTISSSIEAHDAIMAKHDLAVLQYDGYGKDVIKSFKISPDSYTQLVMGLAYYKMAGKVAPTYESAQTRKYKLGRTEVIRSATPDSLEFCKAMEDASKTVSSRQCSLLHNELVLMHLCVTSRTRNALRCCRRLGQPTSSWPARLLTAAAWIDTSSVSRRCVATHSLKRRLTHITSQASRSC